MKIAIIVIAAVVVVVIGIDIVLRLVARRERSCFDKMPPDAQRKYQEGMHKSQSYSNS